MTPTPRLLIADLAPIRIGIRIALAGRVDVCAEAGNAEEAIRAAKFEQPELCLIGTMIPGGGAAAVRGIVRASPATRVIVLADAADAEGMLEAVRAGAVGYVPGHVGAERLCRIVDAVLDSEAALPRAMVLSLLNEVRYGAEVDGLTSREAQVLGMIRRGHSTAAIADRLQIAPVTVRRHVSELVRKLGVSNRAELIESRSAA